MIMATYKLHQKPTDIYGQMRHRISIVREDVASDSTFDLPSADEVLHTVWAAVMPLSQDERAASSIPFAIDVAAFVIRYNSSMTLDTSLVVVYKSAKYDIEGIEDIDENREFYKIKAVKRV